MEYINTLKAEETKILEKMESVLSAISHEAEIISSCDYNPPAIRTAKMHKELWEKELEEIRVSLKEVRDQIKKAPHNLVKGFNSILSY